MSDINALAAIKRYGPKPLLRAWPLLRQRAFTRSPRLAFRWLVSGRELHTFTYDISNRQDLADFVSLATGRTTETTRGYIDELDADNDFRAQLRGRLASRRDRPDDMPYGRRLGWYAFTRILKPGLIVETGVHDGLGSAIFLRALERNAAEGHEGKLLSFDIESDCGWLIPSSLRVRYELVIGNALAEIDRAVAGRPVDLFLHDSDHSYKHETAELEAVSRHARPGTVLLSDNSTTEPALPDFCKRHGYSFALFREQPIDHWYPGDGIGWSVVPMTPPSERSAD